MKLGHVLTIISMIASLTFAGLSGYHEWKSEKSMVNLRKIPRGTPAERDLLEMIKNERFKCVVALILAILFWIGWWR